MNNLQLLEIPEHAAQRATWLEKQIISLKFGEFAAELQVVRDSWGSLPAQLVLDTILGESTARVVQQGLATCSEAQIQQLLSNPLALVELQELVYEAGSDHWFESVSVEPTGVKRLAELKASIEARAGRGVDVADRADTRVTAKAVPASRQTVSGRAQTPGTFNWKWVTLAAGILLMAGLGWRMLGPVDSPAMAKWGWLADDAMLSSATPTEYLAKISAGGEAWFNKDLTNAADYTQRLKELQAGCDLLINADHSILSPRDQQWLVGKCMLWREKIADQQKGVNSDPQNFEQYLRETNGMVESLVLVLSDKAKSI